MRERDGQGGALPAAQGPERVPAAPSEKDGGNVCGAETGKRVKNKKITVWTGISFDEKLLPVLQTFFAKEKVPAYTGCILPYKRTGGDIRQRYPFSFTQTQIKTATTIKGQSCLDKGK